MFLMVVLELTLDFLDLVIKGKNSVATHSGKSGNFKQGCHTLRELREFRESQGIFKL